MRYMLLFFTTFFLHIELYIAFYMVVLVKRATRKNRTYINEIWGGENVVPMVEHMVSMVKIGRNEYKRVHTSFFFNNFVLS